MQACIGEVEAGQTNPEVTRDLCVARAAAEIAEEQLKGVVWETRT